MIEVVELIKNIAIEQSYRITPLKVNVEEAVLSDVYFLSGDGNDKYVLLNVDIDQVDFISGDIQIKIYHQLKFIVSQRTDSDEWGEIREDFDKNTTLILVLNVPNEMDRKELFKKVSLVEEDPYFFKKNIFYYRTNELSFLDRDLVGDRISDLLLRLVSDVNNYSEYVNVGEGGYDIATRFFEKLPFLTFNIPEGSVLNLDQMIDDELNAEDKKILSLVLACESDFSFDDFVSNVKEGR